jgi:prolyl-tRNA synthetase
MPHAVIITLIILPGNTSRAQELPRLALTRTRMGYRAFMTSVLTPQQSDFPQWYQDVVLKAKLAENGPVRGSMVIRPNGYALWERVQAELDTRIKRADAVNAYFPMLIPHSYLQREAQHVEGFSPELAVVTQGGGRELEEPVVVRPTSETIINASFARWVQSYRDLPMLINQWANVVRWEMRSRLFLRTSEFLWQEGHTCHASRAEAQEYALRIARTVYRETMQDIMAIPVLLGLKTDREKFAGADRTYTLEGFMIDGKALQMGTSHELGQNFARAFDIKYQADNGQQEYVWQTSWGASTRLVGALIMSHGDDNGLRIPPRLAPTQVEIIVVRDGDGVLPAARSLLNELTAAGVRAHLDDRVHTPAGRRIIDWELLGVPVRIEIGPRDMAQGQVTFIRRDTKAKVAISVPDAVPTAIKYLDEIQVGLLAEAQERRDRVIIDVTTLAEVSEVAATSCARVPYATVRDAEADGSLGQGVSIRCLQRADGSLPQSTSEAGLVAYVARAY